MRPLPATPFKHSIANFGSSLNTEALPRARNQLTEHPSNKKDLEELASKGHFLKGSSATLGLNKVRDSCEKMQHLGSGTDETGHQDIEDKNDSVERIKQVFAALKVEVKDAEKRLKKFYKM